MHFHHKSAHVTCLNSFKVLLIILVAYGTSVNCSVSPEEVADAMNEVAPMNYCGKKLNDAIKLFCSFPIKNLIMNNRMPVKKSLDSSTDLDFETFDLDRIASENYEDDVIRSRYKLDDTYFSNDIPFLYSAHGNRRRRRGIIDECCKKPCFQKDLIRYCPTRTKAE